MRIEDSVVLVTGAARGLGRAFVDELAARGARKIYAAGRNPDRVHGPGIPVELDITRPDQVFAAAVECDDVNLLVNNAGVMTSSPFLAAPTMDGARLEIETNYLGTLAMCRAFAPVLAANGGGAIVNMLSVTSFFTNPENELARDLPKSRPEDVARQVFDGVEAGQVEVLADARTRRIKSLLPEDHEKIYPAVQERWDAAHPGRSAPGAT
jgi:NAD(P)-dependent dehydrogenase (short-subunit alcohol dehydrogenase family)